MDRPLTCCVNQLFAAVLAAVQAVTAAAATAAAAAAAATGAAADVLHMQQALHAGLYALVCLCGRHSILLFGQLQQQQQQQQQHGNLQQQLLQHVLLQPQLCLLAEQQRPAALKGLCLGDASELAGDSAAHDRQELLLHMLGVQQHTLQQQQQQQQQQLLLQIPADPMHALAAALLTAAKPAALLQAVLSQLRSTGALLASAFSSSSSSSSNSSSSSSVGVASFELSRQLELLAMAVSCLPLAEARKRQAVLQQLALLSGQLVTAAAAQFDQQQQQQQQKQQQQLLAEAAVTLYGGRIEQTHAVLVWGPKTGAKLQQQQQQQHEAAAAAAALRPLQRSFVWRVEAAAASLICCWALKHDMQQLRECLQLLLQSLRGSRSLLLQQQQQQHQQQQQQTAAALTIQEAAGARLYALVVGELLRSFGETGAAEGLLQDAAADLAAAVEAAATAAAAAAQQKHEHKQTAAADSSSSSSSSSSRDGWWIFDICCPALAAFGEGLRCWNKKTSG
ncbi:uncharacterized protein EMH_0081180 [Eimeria mitis]|uniref:Uncharacterized protein n=1 Tax=Eimeria mitis TaxID=44415 RepID=U6K8S5_9EIME|nr:uncharacterized protein EMH_0081180 [Eimeria mitis]CDJ33241.1 hypothetical protein, conserved [Eimeria mitis]